MVLRNATLRHTTHYPRSKYSHFIFKHAIDIFVALWQNVLFLIIKSIANDATTSLGPFIYIRLNALVLFVFLPLYLIIQSIFFIAQLLIDFINILFGPVQNFGIDSNVQFGIYDEENCYVVLSDHIPDDSSFTVSHFSLNIIESAGSDNPINYHLFVLFKDRFFLI